MKHCQHRGSPPEMAAMGNHQRRAFVAVARGEPTHVPPCCSQAGYAERRGAVMSFATPPEIPWGWPPLDLVLHWIGTAKQPPPTAAWETSTKSPRLRF